jgi:MFS family permease
MSNHLISIIKSYTSSYSGISRTCWQGITLNFIESTLIGIYYFLPLYFINNLKFDITVSSIIISFYGLGAILGGYIGGKLSDHISPSAVSIGSLVIQGIVILALIKLKTISLLMIALFLMGIASYGFITSNYLWILNHCNNHEGQRLKAINALSIASNLGLGLSAIIVSALTEDGFNRIFIFSGSLLLLSAIYFHFLEKSTENNSEVEEIKTLPKNKTHASQKKQKEIFFINTMLCILSWLNYFSTEYNLFSLYPKCFSRIWY